MAQELAEGVRVVAKPPGTRTPLAASWLIISPRLAFLPPTASTSVILSCSNGTTRAVASAAWESSVGRLGCMVELREGGKAWSARGGPSPALRGLVVLLVGRQRSRGSAGASD
jgi:hypothetical protein